MQAFGERFRKTVGERLGHDGGIVVVGVLEAFGHRVFADTGRHREGADVVGKPAGARRDEIGQRDIGAALAARQLLAQRMEDGGRFVAALVGKDQDIVAFAVCRPKPEHGAGAEPPLGVDPPQHLLGVGKQAARRFADRGVVEDRRIFSGQLPGREERRPVDVVDQFRDRNIVEFLGAGDARCGRNVVAGPIQRQRVVASVDEREPLFGLFAARMRCGDASIFGADVVDMRSRASRDSSDETTPTARLASLT